MTGKKLCKTNTVEWSLEHMYKPTKTQQLHGTKDTGGYSPKTIQKRTRGALLPKPTYRKEDTEKPLDCIVAHAK